MLPALHNYVAGQFITGGQTFTEISPDRVLANRAVEADKDMVINVFTDAQRVLQGDWGSALFYSTPGLSRFPRHLCQVRPPFNLLSRCFYTG